MMKRTLRVLHSLPALQFAPFFVAAGLKLFEKEGVDVEMIFDGKRERSADLVQQRAVDCFLSGPLRTLVLASKGVQPTAASIVVLNHRCPFYIVGLGSGGREPLEALSGRRVIAHRAAPPVKLLLRRLARVGGIENILWVDAPDGQTELEALSQGLGDYALLAEPEVEAVLSTSRGYIAVSLPEELGPLDYASVIAPLGFNDEQPDLARVIVASVQAAKEWMCRESADSVADALREFTSKIPRSDLVGSLERGQRNGIWAGGPAMARWHYECLQDAYTGEDPALQRVPFSKGVDNRVAVQIHSNLHASS